MNRTAVAALALASLSALPAARAEIGLDLSYVDTSSPAWQRFVDWVDLALDGTPPYGFSASDAVYVYRSVCHAFLQITSYGGWDAHGEHSSGRALDIMTSDVELGTAIAEFLQAHASELNLYDILWRQHIWTPVRAGEGWRSMPSRGSATANHYDHVHVATNG